jgi:very-short-patch-repair endonuclease
VNDADRRLAALAGQQRQVFTRAQARASGLSFNGIRRRIQSGVFAVVGPHTLTFAGVTLDWRGRLQAGLLDLGPAALVSAEAAASLHGLDGFDEGHLVFLVPRELRDRRTIGTVTTSTSIKPLDRTTVDGLAVTSGTRTVIELIGRVSRERLGNAVDSAWRKRLTAPTVINGRLTELGRQGRTGITDFDRVMKMAGVESWLERAFLRLLLSTALPTPTMQRTYRRDGVHIARVDFDFSPLPIIVEVGGKRGYLSSAERQRQERRRNELQLLGKVIYFFTTEDVRSDPEYVIRTLSEVLGQIAS